MSRIFSHNGIEYEVVYESENGQVVGADANDGLIILDENVAFPPEEFSITSKVWGWNSIKIKKYVKLVRHTDEDIYSVNLNLEDGKGFLFTRSDLLRLAKLINRELG